MVPGFLKQFTPCSFFRGFPLVNNSAGDFKGDLIGAMPLFAHQNHTVVVGDGNHVHPIVGINPVELPFLPAVAAAAANLAYLKNWRDTANVDRLEVLVQEHGFSAESMDTDFVKAKIETETESAFDSSVDAPLVERNGFEISSVSAEIVSEAVSASNGHSPETHQPEQYVLEPSATLEQRIAKEIESIEFYIENGYSELAEKAIFELEVEAGPQPEIDALKAKLRMGASEAFEIVETIEPKEIGIEEIRSEFGLEEAETSAENDFETQFQTAIAYQEMGLMEEAIKFFQEAIGLVTAADNSRRSFRCATLIGHCFMETGHPNHSVTWFERALETPELTDDERLGLWYQLALAYAAEGRQDEAHRYFEMVYAENINFRDVAEQLKSELALS